MSGHPIPIGFDEALVRLIRARTKIMNRDICLGEVLCGYTFAEGARVVTLARDRRQIAYSRDYVLAAPQVELEAMLAGIARRAPDAAT